MDLYSRQGKPRCEEPVDAVLDDNSVLTRTRDVLEPELVWVAPNISNCDRPRWQAMVDKGLVPECPHSSMTSAAAMH